MMKILGYNYKIEKADLDDGKIGTCYLREFKIKLDKSLNDENMKSTLIHEIIEAGNYHLELGLEHNQIQCLESILFQTLSDNGVDLSPLLRGVK